MVVLRRTFHHWKACRQARNDDRSVRSYSGKHPKNRFVALLPLVERPMQSVGHMASNNVGHAMVGCQRLAELSSIGIAVLEHPIGAIVQQ